MAVLCTICARGGSKGVKSKNTRLLLGKPLIAYTVEQALASGVFAQIVLSTDSDEIAMAAEKAGAAAWFRRPAELATDTAPKIPAMRHALLEAERHYGIRYDEIIDMDATSPLRETHDILRALEQFRLNHNSVLFSAAPARRSPYFNLVERDEAGRVFLSKNLPRPVVRRQDSPPCFDINGSIYVFTRQALLEIETLFTDTTGLYVMPAERSVDIDSELDFAIVELLLQRRAAGGTI
jgi:CMP-N,N'-diacetyllegionaminic acid synthase